MKYFYSHLIEIESLTFELDQIELAYHEKHELAKLIDSNIYNVVMDAILSKLSEGDKEKFARIASTENHGKVWDFLKSKTENIEEEIKKAAEDIKKKLHQDIKQTKQK